MNRITIVIAALAATGALSSFASAERLSPDECRFIEDRAVTPGYMACPSEPDEAKGSNVEGTSGTTTAGAQANGGIGDDDATNGGAPGAVGALSAAEADGATGLNDTEQADE